MTTAPRSDSLRLDGKVAVITGAGRKIGAGLARGFARPAPTCCSPAAPDHEVQRRLLDVVPMGRLGRPEEMVGAALYLASDLAGYTTGEVIFANGGRAR